MSPTNNPVATPTRIRKAISEHESQVSDLDGELNGLLDLVAQHKSRRAELLKTIAYKKSLIAPVGHLPFEILGMIFVLCIEAQNTTPRQDGERLSKGQILKLILVCRQWKNVAYGTPGVWSRITVGIGHAREPSPKQIRVPMERAGVSPLVFEMVLERDDHVSTEKSERHLDEFIKLLKDLKPNFRSVAIRGFHPRSGFQDYWRPLLTFVEYLASRPQHRHTLQSFSLVKASHFVRQENPRAFNKQETDMLHDAFKNFTALTTLRIPLNILKPIHPVFSWVKNLDVTTSSDLFPDGFSNNVADLIRQGSALESLTMGFCICSGTSADGPFTLPRLRKIHMEGNLGIDHFFQRIAVPALEELSIDEVVHVGGRESILRDAFKSLIEQETGTPPLTKLVVADGSVPEKTLIWALERLPTLVDLEINKSDKFGPKLLAALAKPPTSRKGWLCPGLKRFGIDGCKKVEPEGLIEVIVARNSRILEPPENVSGIGKGKAAEVAVILESLMWKGIQFVRNPLDPVRDSSVDLSDMSDTSSISSTDSSDY